MSKPQAVKIDIESPCKERWDDFEKVSANRSFCKQCEKTVVDFSHMSDQALLQYLQNTQGKVCGKLHKDQLKQYPMPVPNHLFGFKHLRKAMVALALLLLSKPSIGNSQAALKPQTFIQEQAQEQQETAHEKGVTISGQVVDASSREGLPGVSILLKGTNTGVNTDLDGFFTFSQQLKKGDVLLFRYIGMESKEFKIEGNEDKYLTIELQPDIHQLGEVSIAHVYTGKENKVGIWQRISSWF